MLIMLANDNTGIMNGDIVTVMSIATVGEWNFLKCECEKNLDNGY